MSEEESRHILCAASFIDVQSIDGGDTVVMRFRKPDEQEFVILVPRQVALILQPRVSAVLAQQHNPRRYGI